MFEKIKKLLRPGVIHDREDLEKALPGIPILGEIPKIEMPPIPKDAEAKDEAFSQLKDIRRRK